MIELRYRTGPRDLAATHPHHYTAQTHIDLDLLRHAKHVKKFLDSNLRSLGADVGIALLEAGHFDITQESVNGTLCVVLNFSFRNHQPSTPGSP